MTPDLREVMVGSPLTKREREVLLLVGKGYSNHEIGRLLKLSRYTVAFHVRRILMRLDVQTRVEAAVWAAKEGWL